MGEENQNNNAAGGTSNSSNSQFEDFNIFNEIKDASQAQQELSDEKRKKERGALDYLSFWGGLIKIVDFVLLGAILLFGIYIGVQNKFEKPFTQKPLCTLLLGNDISKGSKSCSTVYKTLQNEKDKQKKVEDEIIERTDKMISNILEIEGEDSIEKKFIENVSINKLKILDILGEYERLKLEFGGSDYEKVECNDIKINEDKTMTLECSAYSNDWDDIDSYTVRKPANFNTPLSGRSISVALSFIDYIETNGKKLKIIQKDLEFSESEKDEEDDSGINYMYKTSFKLTLQYNGDTLLF